jgi:hypothetical protein
MAVADEKSSEKADDKAEDHRKRDRVSINLDDIRARVAQIVWFICVIAALILAVGALCIALKANQQNDLVDLVLDWADRVDLGVFSRVDGIKEFTGKNADIKNALVNWGLGAIVWLVIGRILDRIIRP